MNDAVLRPKAGAASRGTLSPRYKQDILFAVRLAKKEGVQVQMHGITLTPASVLESKARIKGKGVPTKQDREQSEAGKLPSQPSRSVARLQEFQGKKIASMW